MSSRHVEPGPAATPGQYLRVGSHLDIREVKRLLLKDREKDRKERKKDLERKKKRKRKRGGNKEKTELEQERIKDK